jgi:hypothetical protein
MSGKIIGSLITDDDDLITVVKHPAGQVVVTVNQGASEPEKMPTYFFALTSAEADELRELL